MHVWPERKDTTFIYGRRIIERKGRPGTFRVHVKYQIKNITKFETPSSNFETHVGPTPSGDLKWAFFDP